jgi:WD40 repeat protein
VIGVLTDIFAMASDLGVHLNGQPVGRLHLPQQTDGAGGLVALAAVESQGAPLMISGQIDGTIRSWDLGKGHSERLQPDRLYAVPGGLAALTTANYYGDPLIISASLDGVIRNWHLDGRPVPFEFIEVRPPVRSGVVALTAVDYQSDPLIVSGHSDGSIHSWRLDGRPGPGARSYGDTAGGVMSLAAVEYHGEPLIISASVDGSIRSWRLDGRTGPLQLSGPHTGAGVVALAVAEYAGESLIISISVDGVIRNWRLDGRPGPQLDDPSSKTGTGTLFPTLRLGWVALAAAEFKGELLIISGHRDGRLHAWQLNPGRPDTPLTSFGTRTAAQLELRQLSFASPLELQLVLPASIAAAPAILGWVFYAIKRVWGFDLEIRTATGRSSERNFWRPSSYLSVWRPTGWLRPRPPWRSWVMSALRVGR